MSDLTPEQLQNTPIGILRRDYSPDDVLNSIYLKALEHGYENDFEDLSRMESLVIATWLTWGAMGNGGVYCAMNNPFSLMEAADAMEAIGHLDAAKGMRSGSAILFPNGQSTNRDVNEEMIFQYEDLTGKDPDDLFEDFANSAIDMTERLIEFIFANWDEYVASDKSRMAT